MTPSSEGAGEGIARGPRGVDYRGGGGERRARLRDHRGRPVADPHSPALALEQAKAKLGLELEDLAAKRGLAHVAGRRRAAEMLMIGDGDDIFEVSEVHGGTIGHDDSAIRNNRFEQWSIAR